MPEKYDYLVIGSGPAGYVSAIRAAQLGLKVAVVEKDRNMLGGVCLNEGCIPAKSLFRSASIFNIVKRSPELFGLEVKYKRVNMAKMVEKSRQCAEDLSKGLLFLFKKNKIDLINGKAAFRDNKTVQVEGEEESAITVQADKFLIAAGSTPREIPGVNFDGKKIINSSQAIRLEKVPKSILIIGGGAIGVEFASFFNMLGSEVTIIELLDSLLPLADGEVSRRFQSIFKQRGIKVHTSSPLGEEVIKKEAHEKILVAVGRVPATSGIGLEEIGVKTDEHGYIPVDFNMRTVAENIYAAGDVLWTPMLAHAAYAEGEAAAEAAAGNQPEAIDYTCVPNAVYSDVQAASVGITEEEAKAEDLPYKTGKQLFKASGKAVINSETEGFIKIIADDVTHKILGAHIVGSEAAELIHEFVLAKKAGLTVEEIEKTVHAHPTFSETAIDACRSVFGKPLHG
ncbi:MAG: dihydrolipoyl dehydrogenase [Candidatus Omnitrophota bacterium]